MTRAILFIVTLTAVTIGLILLVDRYGDATAADCEFTAAADVGSCR